MVDKRKRQQRKHFNTVFALGRAKAEQMKGRDKTMLQTLPSFLIKYDF